MTGYFFDQQPASIVDPGNFSTGSATGFAENFGASLDAGIKLDTSVAHGALLNKLRNERTALIEEFTGKGEMAALSPYLDFQQVRASGPSNDPAKRYDAAVDRALHALRRTLPDGQAGTLLSESEIQQRAREMALEAEARNADVAQRATGFGTVGQVAGAATAQGTDPLVVATLPLGASFRAGIIATMGIEAALAAGVTAAQQPAIQKWRKELGLPSGFDEAVKNVGTAALFGGVAGGAVKGVAQGIGALNTRVSKKKLLKAHQELIPDPNPTQRAARTELEAEVAFDETNPYRGEGSDEAHAERLTEATRAVANGEQPTFSAPSPADTRPVPETIGGRPQSAEGVYSFDPADLAVDARRFQFKDGGDASGVTDRLEGVERWDATRAGIVLVWEDGNGARFIADGHQRRGLAARIAESDPQQKPRLTGYLLREADGYSDKDARALAAAKNIAEGSGSPIDAAKILRDRPELGLDLPPKSALVRDARGLAVLSDDAFGMVVNRIVEPNHAAILGRLAPTDSEIHAQALGVLAEVKPRGAVEAESVIRDVLSAPQVRAVQDSLFGSDDAAELLYKERARILAASSRRVAKDRAAFGTLVREEGRLKEEGNVLKTEANAERTQDDARILAILQQQARGTGPLAEALARASRDLKTGASLDKVVGRFVDDARRSAASQFSDGGSPGGTGRGSQGGDDGGAPEAGSASRELTAGETALDDGAELPTRLARIPENDELLALADPGSDAMRAEADQLTGDLKRRIADEGDFDVMMDDETTRKASEILADADADDEFADQLGFCLK